MMMPTDPLQYCGPFYWYGQQSGLAFLTRMNEQELAQLQRAELIIRKDLTW